MRIGTRRAGHGLGVLLVSISLAGCFSQSPPPQEYGLGAPEAAATADPSQATSRSEHGGNAAQRAQDVVYFNRDSAQLSGAAQSKLRQQIQWLKTHPDARVVVQGHADEWGTREYNLALGAKRAIAVKGFLHQNGLRAMRIDTVSYGKERLVADCVATACRSKNRRAETILKPAGG